VPAAVHGGQGAHRFRSCARLHRCGDFISATNVWTGKQLAIFKTGELTADHLMASDCLPTVFQAVEIDGRRRRFCASV
jgi:NTE family protein